LAEAFRQADALEGPLDERLRFYLGASRKLLPDLETTYDWSSASGQMPPRIAFLPLAASFPASS
jgi:hypothetical protein